MRMRHLVSAALAGLMLVIMPWPTGAQNDTWLHYRDPGGVAFDYPATWTVDTSEGFIVVADPAFASFIMIYAFTEDQDYTAQQCVTDTVGALQDTLPDLTITSTQQAASGLDDVSATLSYTASDGEGFAGLVCRLDRGQGLLYLGATPVSQYEQQWPVITAIADSISLTPAGDVAAAVPDAHLTYVTWTDPLDSAFTVDVPKEWAVEGGMFDTGGIKRPVFQLTAPGDRIRVSVGLTDVIWFLEPTSALTEGGYSAGSTFFEQDGVTVMVAGYHTGGQAAQLLAELFIAPLCETFETTATRDLGDGYAADDGSYLNTGEAAFTCETGGEPVVGYYYVTTRATYHATLGQVWMIDTALSYLALAAEAPLAGAVLARVAVSFALTPAWVAAQPPPDTTTAAGTWHLDPDADLDPASLDILMEVNQMMHDTSLIIIDNIDGYADYEYDYDYDYGW